MMENWVEPLMAWYPQVSRVLPWRDLPTPYRVWVSEIMLQQTRVEAVIPYFLRFMEALPTVEALAEAQEDTLLKLWEGLGYYSRVRNLQKAARQVMADFGGEIPRTVAELRSLTGIGPYTAGAVASIAYGVPAAAVDGNVLRVITRITGDHSDIMAEATKKKIGTYLEERMPSDPGVFNQALMELGATVCIPNGAPKCALCPVAAHCVAGKEATWDVLPVKTPKKPRKMEHKTVDILVCNGKVALEKRPDKGLLAGLWQFPETSHGLTVLSALPLTDTKHIFTHIEWHMKNRLLSVAEERGSFLWLTPAEIDADYALPTAFKKAWKEARREIEG